MATIIAETDDLGGSAHRHDVGAAALQVLTEPNVVRKAALTRELVARIFSADRAKWTLPTAVRDISDLSRSTLSFALCKPCVCVRVCEKCLIV